MSVSVVLSCFRRPHVLKQQYESVINQSVKPDEILIWRNPGNDISDFNKNILKNCKFADSNYNFGVWARFTYALNAKSDFVMVVDDDSIMGSNWIKNCLECQEQEKSVLGTIGVVFNDLTYTNYYRIGWANPNDEKAQVDLIGHNFFFPRECLGAFFFENEVPLHNLSGEDCHLSYSAQRYLGYKTYVPPHPYFDQTMWGSLPEEANKYGSEDHCISVNCHQEYFGKNLEHYYKKGMKFLNIS